MDEGREVKLTPVGMAVVKLMVAKAITFLVLVLMVEVAAFTISLRVSRPAPWLYALMFLAIDVVYIFAMRYGSRWVEFTRLVYTVGLAMGVVFMAGQWYTSEAWNFDGLLTLIALAGMQAFRGKLVTYIAGNLWLYKDIILNLTR
jgi:hypothetical protein